MPGPFYNAIKGTTAGTPGTGAFTPNAASAGFRAWSTVPSGWMGLVRFEDGSAWELSWCHWNGTLLSRGTNQLYDSSTGSVLSLTSAATAAQIIDASEVRPHPIVPVRQLTPIASGTTSTASGIPNPTATGTAAASGMGTTNYMAEQPKVRYNSATTASAGAGVNASVPVAVAHSTAGRGGWEMGFRFGFAQIPTGMRVWVGATNATLTLSNEPSVVVNCAMLGKDSTDTNFQLMHNDGSGTCTKVDTGVLPTVNDWYEMSIWSEPGSLDLHFLLMCFNTGVIFYQKATTNLIPSATTLIYNLLASLSGTTGTAVQLEMGGVAIRSPA